ncbi:MAG: TVP38/TMEM64 family protein [Deltaproteobacteria bacterium]
MTQRGRVLIAGSLAITAVAVVLTAPTVMSALHDMWAGFSHSKEALRAFILSHGPFAPLVFVFLQALQVVAAPVPGEATGFIAGFLFGAWEGFFLAMGGLVLGSFLAFSLARSFRGLVKRYLERSSAYARFEHLVEHQGIFLFFFLFLFPGFPKDFLCYILGLSHMPWQVFLFITAIGRIPGTFMLTLQGASVYDGDVGHMALVFGATALIVLPAWLARERLYAWVEHQASPQEGDER